MPYDLMGPHRKLALHLRQNPICCHHIGLLWVSIRRLVQGRLKGPSELPNADIT